MSTFTVMSAERGESKQTNYGLKAAIKLTLKNGVGDQIEGEWFTRADAPLPAVGGQEEFEVSDGPYGKKLTRPRTGFGGGRTPRDSGRIERQHSQDMAVQLMAAFEPRGESRTAKAYLEVVKDLTDWFVADLDNASTGGGGGAVPSISQQSGPPTTAASSAAGISDKQKGFLERLLTEAEVDIETRNQVMAWASETLTGGGKGSASKAIDGMQNNAAETVPRLLAAASAWAASHSDIPPPDESGMQDEIADDDDIPF